MNVPRRVISALVVAVVMMTHALGVSAKEPSEIDKDAARTSLEQGDERMRAKDYKSALEAYQRADNIMGVPTTSIEVGRAALALGRLVIAYDAFKRTADFPKKPGEPPPFTSARKEAKGLASDIKPRIPLLEIEVTGAASDADVEVLVDEDVIDAWGSALRIDPGLHDIRARATGYDSVSEQVVVQEGERRTVVLKLVALAGPAADVATSESSLWWTVAVVTLPIGGASLIAGAVTGGLSLSQASDVREQCDGNRCPPEVDDKLNSSQTLAHVSTATLVVGGVALALGITALTIAITTSTDEDEEDPSDEIEVTVGPTNVGLTFRF